MKYRKARRSPDSSTREVEWSVHNMSLVPHTHQGAGEGVVHGNMYDGKISRHVVYGSTGRAV